MPVTVPAAEVAGIISGGITVVVFAAVVGVLCWRFPSCRSRTFWDKNIKRAIRKLYGKCKKKKVKEEKKSLIIGPMIRKRSRDEPPFVVPQIFVRLRQPVGTSATKRTYRNSFITFSPSGAM
ncbi:uncharacterized protein LOC131940427 [Physella acuta]|uniref:uncharacterized protein LOC131940427 n=1 Tax=Physella acuta TaxID=109671 RepID=UPI0027DABC69|nr:uncharacterized protein LOC131940427 [Physella acuta]